ncbi:MAG: PAAR-like domain-containing protein [Candidatus Thiodiazotropha sp.]
MANDVFANGREISCKKADGKSICAFPDVCFTPPENPTTPPGVPVPYPNTGFAKDTTKGSKKVKISGKEVILKNKSYFKKSTGDEAGSATKKGILTSVNRGKIYFTSWSMNVKVEKKNVARHLDMTTHNHSSYPSNTTPWPYADEMMVGEGGVCEGMDHLMLVPYSPGCPGDQTPHHLIPDRCTKGMTGYSHSKAPCVCVLGRNQHTGSHRACHRVFDPIERVHHDNPPFEYRTARYAAAASAGGAMNPPRQLDENEKTCVESQLNNYYTQSPPNGPGFSERSHLQTQGARGKVNELYDEAASVFGD